MTSSANRTDRPQAILFDWDNTLVDNWEVIRGAMNATLVAFDMAPWSVEETRQRVARSARDGFPDLFGDRWQEAQGMFYEHFSARHLQDLRPLAGAADILTWLADEGYWLAVVSNKRGDLLRAEAEHLGWNRFFRHIIGANDADEDKPAPAPVTMALDGSGVPAGPAVWFVGDGPIDVKCAHNAGCVAVLFEGSPVPTPAETGPGPQSEAPDFRVSGHSELATLVRSC